MNPRNLSKFKYQIAKTSCEIYIMKAKLRSHFTGYAVIPLFFGKKIAYIVLFHSR